MVFFSCDGCAETLKKSKVDAHAARCRACVSVSCVDCSVSFWGDDYRAHTSCISEAERYEKTVYKGPKKNNTSNRKQTPQETWLSIITESLENCPPALVPYIEKAVTYENVPRKEKAFRNFASNSLSLYGRDGDAIISSIWKHFSTIRQKRAEEKEAAQKKSPSDSDDKPEKNSSDNNDEGNVSTEKEKKPLNDNLDSEFSSVPKNTTEDSTPMASTSKKEKKVVRKAIKKALKKSPKHQLKLKDLRKMLKVEKILTDKTQGKDEWKELIKEAILESKKSMELKGKRVVLIEKN